VAVVRLYEKGITKVLGEKRVPVPLWPHKPHRTLLRGRTFVSKVTGRRPTVNGMGLQVFCGKGSHLYCGLVGRPHMAIKQKVVYLTILNFV